MKRTIQLTLGVLTLSVALTAVTLEANAATWSNALSQSSQDYWTDGGVEALLWTGSRRTYFAAQTTSGNQFTGGVFVYCSDQPMHGYGGQTWTGSKTYEYWCPGASTIDQAQAWIDDL